MRQIRNLGVVTLAILVIYGSPVTMRSAQSQQEIPIWWKNGNYAKEYELIVLSQVTISDLFKINNIRTTPFGPAWADIWIEGANFLQCNPPQAQDFSYAVCYYSGPDDPTGLSTDNPALPCTLSAGGKAADCTCYKLSTAVVPPQVPYFVDIHSILNLDIYQQTVAACGSDGKGCAPTTSIQAPVCSSINTNQLMPGADLVSVFSPVKKLDYFAGSTACPPPGTVYAGCMTAPCYDTGKKDANGNALVDCTCPIYNGPFEIGQGAQGDTPLQCDLGHGNVWSAAHNPIMNNPIDPPFPGPEGTCIPDMPPDSGCPLYPDGTGVTFDPSGATCKAVCDTYKSPGDGGIQIGYTCDAALCTTLGLGQKLPLTATMGERFGLMAQACDGIQNLDGLDLIATVETLAKCSCCASQICGCAGEDINVQTNGEILRLNAEQSAVDIWPQCELNGTLCGM